MLSCGTIPASSLPTSPIAGCLSRASSRTARTLPAAKKLSSSFDILGISRSRLPAKSSRRTASVPPRQQQRLEVSSSALYNDDAIGAEHGEGFATFRPRGPLQVDVDYLNDRMQTTGLQRIRFAMKPDEAFGLIYSFDNVIADTRSLRLLSWHSLAKEAGKPFPESPEKLRLLTSLSPERAIREVLCWAEHPEEIEHLAGRAAELYVTHLSQVRAPIGGVREWLGALFKAGVPCAVASSMDRLTLLAALDRMKLYHFFRAFVSSEDGMESIAHRFLSAAVKLDRPPAKCVVFEDDPRGITAAHNCSMKAVALIGQHTAYELQQADMAVGGFSDLSVINLRRLFANRGLGLEFMEVQQMREGKEGRRQRRTTTGTMF